MKQKSIMVIAGEISGDLHAAALVRAVRQRAGTVHFFGIGGNELEKAGMEICRPARDMAVLGLSEVLRKYLFFRKTFREMVALLQKRGPDAVLLVDYPGFNLPFAAKAHQLGFKVLYYICPQVWAWRRGRIQAMAKSVDRLLTIFPFEAEVFKGTGLKVDFIGHPLVGAAEAGQDEPLAALPWSGSTRIAILPGSRRQEIKLILPVMVSAALLLKGKNKDAGFIIAAASHEVLLWIEQVLAEMGLTGKFAMVVEKTRQILKQANAAWVASGTATIEAALMNCPMVIVYRTALLTYLAGRMLIRVPYLGMVNIVAKKKICPEFIQYAATPVNLANAIEPLLSAGVVRSEMLAGLAGVRAALGPPGAGERAAEIVLQELE
jgi:lipid-A-disaccharide synthase